MKSIIEIGKSTVENAKQLSGELAKDNKRRQMKETDLENKLQQAEEAFNEAVAGKEEKNNVISSLEAELEQRRIDNN